MFSRLKFVQLSLVALLLSFNNASNAGVILDWQGTGVDFYSSWLDSTTLRIEIDAQDPTGGWANATYIDSIAINSPADWSWSSSSDITLDGPGTFSGGVMYTGLNANGCQSLTLGGNHQCWDGLAALTDNMYFDFTFADASLITNYTDTPHLKVRFVDDNGGKVGSLLSQDLGVEVVEPSSLAMLALGVFGLVAARRRVAR